QYAAPVGERDPRKRLAHVHAFVRQARQEPALDLLGRLAPLMARLPAAALGLIGARLAAVQDAQISNVPGFNQPMYVAGAQVLHNWGFGPAPGCAMMIGMTTYNGVCSIGVTSDRAAVIEPELLADCLRQGLQEMIALGSPPAPRTTATARKKPRKKA
ncbi:MAG: WS/DGAT domain-containing protein, partial [Rhodoferax sp.]